MCDILIVEDNWLSAVLIREIALSAGFNVFICVSYSEALKVIHDKKRGFHLIVTDFYLMDGNGVDLARKIKKIKRYENKKIILLSGKGFSQKEKKELEKIFFDILLKPIDVFKLKNIFEELKKR
ncbi:MAG: response regulator [Alphaproteobacteria bacterium]|nr:response regulator [Alphaproteobacteria bacterium]